MTKSLGAVKHFFTVTFFLRCVNVLLKSSFKYTSIDDSFIVDINQVKIKLSAAKNWDLIHFKVFIRISISMVWFSN